MTEQIATTINLQILTPQKHFLEQEVEMVTIPAFDGEMGVLPGHISMLVTLQPGLVKIYQGGIVVHSVFVDGGFAQVNNDRVSILIEAAFNRADVNYRDALSRMEAITLKLMNVDDPEYQKILERELAVYQKMAEIAQGD